MIDLSLAHLAVAQSFDPSILVTNGPLGLIAAVFAYLWGKERDAREKDRAEYKVEIAAERALNAQLQSQRLDDQKTLIPLGNSLTVAAEQLVDVMKSQVTK